jgi:hypothetical protein
MAWFWSNRDEEEEEDEDNDDEYYDEDGEEYMSEDENSKEDFAEEEEDEEEEDNDELGGDDDDDRPNDGRPVATQNDTAAVSQVEDLLSQKSVVEERRANGDDDDSCMREDEFAQLVGGDPPLHNKNEEQVAPKPTTNNGSSSNHQSRPIATTEHQDHHENLEQEEEAAADEEEEVTTLEEKQSLLTLAAEHDRVDILQAILSNHDDIQKLLHGGGGSSGGGSPAAPASATAALLPPLHVAIAHGSVNAVNCLLRMGADPSIRSSTSRYHGKTAWEVAFDRHGGSSNVVAIAPSKREGIRHAFTAEALRCIGADEVDRLQQLLDAGLPKDCEVGGQSLAEWTVDLGAAQCQALVGAVVPATEAEAEDVAIHGGGSSSSSRNRLVQYEKEGLPALENRLDELNNLSKALSQFLDNLAEEVSVCAGLLLVGSGAAALAAHVKSLKQQKVTLTTDVERHSQVWENSEDELAYWVKECGGVDILKTLGGSNSSTTTSARQQEQIRMQQQQQQHQSSGSSTKEERNETDDDIKARQRFQTQIAACETKIRMLRASIADLSDENQRNLVEVQRRGVQGGVRLVRTLREAIVELEYQLSEIDSGEAACRAKIQLLQQYLKTNPIDIAKKKKTKEFNNSNGSTAAQASGETMSDDTDQSQDGHSSAATAVTTNGTKGGRGRGYNTSTALIVRPTGGQQGFLPFSIWQLFLRIIGLSQQQLQQHQQPHHYPQQQQQQQRISYDRPAMIV